MISSPWAIELAYPSSMANTTVNQMERNADMRRRLRRGTEIAYRRLWFMIAVWFAGQLTTAPKCQRAYLYISVRLLYCSATET